MAKPKDWLKANNREEKVIDSNAIHWLDQYVRDPLPKRIIWDLKTRADRTAEELWSSPARGRQHYWLADKDLLNEELIVKFSKKRNHFKVEKATASFQILLSSEMVDFSKALKVTVAGENFVLKVKPRLKTSMQSLVDRGDINYLFEAVLGVELTAEGCSVKEIK